MRRAKTKVDVTSGMNFSLGHEQMHLFLQLDQRILRNYQATLNALNKDLGTTIFKKFLVVIVCT